MGNMTLKQKPDQINIEIQQLINDKMNNDLKSHYGKILSERYNISREVEIVNNNQINSSNKPRLLFGLAAVILLSIIGINTYVKSAPPHQPIESDVKQMVYQYMAENKVAYYNNTRSQAKETLQLRRKAYTAFEMQDYLGTIELLNNIKDKNTEDLFFTGISYLEIDAHKNAIQSFNSCLSKLKSGDSYYHEATLYLVVSYILNDQNDLANLLFKTLEKDSWEYEQLQHIMNNVS